MSSPEELCGNHPGVLDAHYDRACPVNGSNQALWLLSPHGRFAVRESPTPTAGPGELVVRVHAVAVNPVDAVTGLVRRVITPWVRYPTVIGSDVAGVVTQVGAGVTRFRTGDRVVAYAAGQERSRNAAGEGAFQEHVLVLERVACPLPDSVSFTQAAVLPLGLSTAAAGLFERDHLGLPHPTHAPTARTDVVLVWGASTSVGCNAVQLARASGFAVLATAGPSNHALVRSLGAEAVFDYREKGTDRQIIEALGGRSLAGIIAIGAGSLGHAVGITRRCPGAKRIASAQPDPLNRVRALPARARGVTVSWIWGGTPTESDVGPAIFRDFLPDALRSRQFRPAPEPRVTGQTLHDVPEALAILRAGVSAAKVVVTLIPEGEPR